MTLTRRATKKMEAGLCKARPRRALASTQVELAAVSLMRRSQKGGGEAVRSTPPPRPCVYACRARESTHVEPAAVSLTRRTEKGRGARGCAKDATAPALRATAAVERAAGTRTDEASIEAGGWVGAKTTEAQWRGHNRRRAPR